MQCSWIPCQLSARSFGLARALRGRRLLAGLSFVLASSAGGAVAFADPALTIRVTDPAGEPVSNAVVTLFPLDEPLESETAKEEAVLAQRDHRFVPYVLAIPRGTRVQFPNFDDTRHHVYSFSAIRPFEIQLYRGDPEVTIDFPQTGVAVVGCNIHDWMEAYIFVTDAPFFAVTGDGGEVTFDVLPPGRVEVRGWHPWQQDDGDPWKGTGETVAESTLVLVIDLTPPPPRRPAENALQQWFQNP